MTSDSESVKDKTVLNFTENPCEICGPSTHDEAMVGCDECSGWFHTRCVGIKEGEMPKSWYCQSKACQEKAQEYQKRKKQTRNRKQTDESDKSSVNSRLGASIVNVKVRALEERQKRQMEELETEMHLRKKERELQRAYEKKIMELELQIRAEEEEEELAWQAEMLRKKTEQVERMKANQESFEERLASMDKELAGLSSLKVPKPASKIDTSVLRVEPSSKINRNALKLMKGSFQKFVEDDENTEEEDDDGEYSKNSDLRSQGSDSSMERKVSNNASRVMRNKVNSVRQDGLGQQQTGPTKAQLAARRGLTYKLPKFSGNPAQWPLFYAAYKASNDACGYMNHENLMRLQEALEGDALELVSGQLLLPETIPRVIEKLRRHYGRPEQLLESLLDKVNRLDPPQPDNLKSFIPFGNTVEQLCGHLEAADLRQHLVNPLLIKSLVAKLPDREKREWVHYRKGRGETTLRTLTDFLMEIVEDACEANVDVEFKPPTRSSQSGRSMPMARGGLYCHSAISSSPANTGEKILKPCNQCRRTEHRLRHCSEFKKMRYADRLRLVNREKLCHVCLNKHGGQCKFKIRCNIGECREFHNPLMHPVGNVVGLSAHIRTNCTVLFRIVPVQLHCGEKSATVLAFLDEGASVTLVEKGLADRLGAVGVQERLVIRWTGNVSRVEDTRRTSLWVSGTCASVVDKTLLHTVHTVGKLMLPHQKLDFEEIVAQYPHMRGLSIDSYDGQPQLLIGANNIHSFVPIEARVGNPMEPIAVRTNLGWTVYGPKRSTTVASSNYLGYHQQVNDENLQELLKSQYALEESVMVVSEQSEEKRGTTKRVGDHSETRLLRSVEEERPAVPENCNREWQKPVRAVGVIWDPNMDQCAFYKIEYEELKSCRHESERSAKRFARGCVKRTFGPSVLVPRVRSTSTIRGKIVRQHRCRSKQNWRGLPTKWNVAHGLLKWRQGPPLQSNATPSSAIEETEEAAKNMLHKAIDDELISRWSKLLWEEASVGCFVINYRRKGKGKLAENTRVPAKGRHRAHWDSFPDEKNTFTRRLKYHPDGSAEVTKRSGPIYQSSLDDGKIRKSWKRGIAAAVIPGRDML